MNSPALHTPAHHTIDKADEARIGNPLPIGP